MKIFYREVKTSFDIQEPFYVIEYEKKDYPKLIKIFLEIDSLPGLETVETESPSDEVCEFYLVKNQYGEDKIMNFISACART